MSEALREAEERFEDLGGAQKPFALPLLKAIELEGGEARRKAAIEATWKLIGDQLNEKQREHLYKKHRLGWVRFALKDRGFLTGERGMWRLTDRARVYLDAHRDDPLAGMGLTEDGYAELTGIVVEIARKHGRGRILSCLEGGYNLKALSASVERHVCALLEA